MKTGRLFAILASIAVFAQAPLRAQSLPGNVPLRDGWAVQSACEVKATGVQISTAGFSTLGWHVTSVPATVVAALVADKTLPDPYIADNIRSLPGMSYPAGTNFSNLPMPTSSPFHCGWWYRTEFSVGEEAAAFAGAAAHAALKFDGINYRASIWINGKKIADQRTVAGTFRTYEFDVSRRLRRREKNALAVEVFPPTPKDLGLTWVDWNPAPPDKNLGLWKGVTLRLTGAVAIEYPYVVAEVAESLTTAQLTVKSGLHNNSWRPVRGVLTADIGGLHLRKTVTLAPRQRKAIVLTPDDFPELKLTSPRLWWPVELGSPELYSLKLAFKINGEISDLAEQQFGIRKVTSELTPDGRLFKVNGHAILIRGAGWAPDLLLRYSPTRLETEFKYVRDLGLNTLRLEGKFESEEFYRLADRYGILVMSGWCCCDMWEEWNLWNAESKKIAAESLRSQIRVLRAHPSAFLWLNGSDNPPTAEIEKMYLSILHDEDWSNPYLSSATDTPTSVTGESGVRMTGPYDYVPPNYWLEDKKFGGAHGFNTETCPGPAVPGRQSLARMLGEDHLWPVDDVWKLHAGGGRYASIGLFGSSLVQRYGPPVGLDDFLRKSQAMAYEGERAMLESYARNKYRATGVIQWMLNNAWPSVIWHLYDYYLVPGGGYYGAKHACQSLHAMYSYDDRSIVVVNTSRNAFPGLRLTVEVFAFDMKKKFSRSVVVDAEADSSTRVLSLPEIRDLSTTYFVRTRLLARAGNSDDPGDGIISDNFYWLSTRADRLDWGETTGAATPQSAYADLTDLNKLPAVRLNAEAELRCAGDKATLSVTLSNPSRALAFMVHLRLADARTEEDIVPVLWSDNYVSLLPGERRTIRADDVDPGAADRATLWVEGWNIESNGITVELQRRTTPERDSAGGRLQGSVAGENQARLAARLPGVTK